MTPALACVCVMSLAVKIDITLVVTGEFDGTWREFGLQLTAVSYNVLFVARNEAASSSVVAESVSPFLDARMRGSFSEQDSRQSRDPNSHESVLSSLSVTLVDPFPYYVAPTDRSH